MTHNDPGVCVALAADEKYALPLAVAVRSLADNFGGGRQLTVYVLDGGFTLSTKRNLRRSWPAEVDVRFVAAAPKRLANLPVPGNDAVNSYLNRSMYLRLLIPDLLPSECGKALYLDADTLTVADITALWDVELRGYPVGAVSDPYIPVVSHQLALHNYKELNLAPDAKYFNSGVLLMNLDVWRAEDLSDRVIDYLASHEDLYLPDQEALNAVLAGRWKQLDPSWNTLILDEFLTQKPQKEHDETWARWRVRKETVPPPDARILHFAFTTKPWTDGFRHEGYWTLYHDYRSRTAWADRAS